jgi:ATP-dependent protease ClpP protease subunit
MPQAQSQSKFRLNFSNNAEADIDLEIFDEISDWWGYGLKELAWQLRGQAGRIKVRLNSYGGDLIQGLAIMNFLKSHQGGVTVEVLGVAASAATFIVAGADMAILNTGSFYMIHNPYTYMVGDSKEMSQAADALGKMENEMIQIYFDGIRKRKKMDNLKDDQLKAQVKEWMDNETWFTSSEAVEYGFADSTIEAAESVSDSAISPYASSMTGYRNTPQRILNLTTMSKIKETSNFGGFLAGLKNMIAGAEKEGIGNETKPTTPVKAKTDGDEDDEFQKAKALVEAKGFKVAAQNEDETEEKTTEVEVNETTEDAPETETFTEEQVQARIDAAIAAQAKKAMASKPVTNKPAEQTNPLSRADQIRQAHAAKFDAFASALKG